MFKKLSLYQHLIELRMRLVIASLSFIIASGICYIFCDWIYMLMTKPLFDVYSPASGRKLIFTGLTEAFFVNLKLAFFAGFIVSFPIIAWQIYSFVAPGLYRNEKKVFIIYLISSPLLFLLGALLVYFYVMPLAWQFFISFENVGDLSSLPIKLEARISEYLSLVISLITGFGLAFQLPIILILLCQLGIINAETLSSMRRYWIVIIFIIAAILTPPDVISQIALAIPLLLLYEISILICKKIGTKP